MKSNKFSRALTHLKKDLSEAGPTNSMKQVYSDNRGGFRLGKLDPERIFYPASDGSWPAGIPGTAGEEIYVRPRGYWEEGPGTIPTTDWDNLLTSDFSYSTQESDPRNTDTIIDSVTGFVKSSLPPNSRSFILGPLVDSYFHNHGNDNQTRIGYIQKDTRELVILARIDGTWGNDAKGNLIPADGFEESDSTRRWNGLESGFTAINENFTFEMLQWFYERLKTGSYVKNASFFLAGGVGCIIGGGGQGQPSGTTQGNAAGGPTQGSGGNAGNNGNGSGGPYAGSGGNPNSGNPQDAPAFGSPPTAPVPNPPTPNPNTPPPPPPNSPPPPEEEGKDPGEIYRLRQAMVMAYEKEYAKANRQALAITGGILLGGWTLAQLKAALGAAILAGGTYAVIKARMEAVYNDAYGSLSISSDPYGADLPGSTTTGDNPRAKTLTPQQQAEVEAAGNELRDARRALNDLPANATDAQKDMAQERLDRATKRRQSLRKKHREENKHRKESVKVPRDRRRRILREVKQPYVLPEIKKEKYKPNFAGKFRAQNTPDVTASKQSDDLVRSKNSGGQVWRTNDKYWSGYETTERMNVIQDRVGHGKWYFDSITNSNSQDYEKITERFKDTLKERELQEHLNTLAHEKAMREIESDYVSPFRAKEVVQEQETMWKYYNDPLVKKVAKRLRNAIEYPDKPSRFGVPNDPAPELDPVTGMHPEYGKAQVYSKLDPDSAETMSRAPTGNPDIDANVQKARRLKPVKSVSNNASPKLETPLKKGTKKKT